MIRIGLVFVLSTVFVALLCFVFNIKGAEGLWTSLITGCICTLIAGTYPG